MIYLVQLDNVYKIGYTDNIKERINSLSKTHLNINLISLREGDIKHEKLLHKACKEFHIKNELFEINDLVVDIFKNYQFDTIANNKIHNIEYEINELKSELNKLKEDYDKSLTIITKLISSINENIELKINKLLTI